jgi:hypothetical protein
MNLSSLCVLSASVVRFKKTFNLRENYLFKSYAKTQREDLLNHVLRSSSRRVEYEVRERRREEDHPYY